jgi:hypothetical protein
MADLFLHRLTMSERENAQIWPELRRISEYHGPRRADRVLRPMQSMFGVKLDYCKVHGGVALTWV